jgi:hypothetical protein
MWLGTRLKFHADDSRRRWERRIPRDGSAASATSSTANGDTLTRYVNIAVSNMPQAIINLDLDLEDAPTARTSRFWGQQLEQEAEPVLITVGSVTNAATTIGTCQ